MLSSNRALSTVIAACGAILLALAFPKFGAAWLAPFGAAALFLAWEGTSWKRAFATGFFAGWVFFTISFWWWSTTIVSEVGWLAYVAVIAGAAIEACFVGLAGILGAIARQRAVPVLAPIGTAAAFAMMEWLRSIGPIGVPFAQLGYVTADTPVRVFAAFIGTNGTTFVLCAFGAYTARAIVRRSYRALTGTIIVTIAVTAALWQLWPAHELPPPTIPVAAVQGNIAQSLKWQPGLLQMTIDRYTAMTQATQRAGPKIVLWPETVIALNGLGLTERPDLIAQFSKLAKGGDTTLVAGSIRFVGGKAYNSLFVFMPIGMTGIYDKHQLVPFAEHFPGQAWLWWLPYVGSLNGNFGEGTGNTVFATNAGLSIGPLICWESAFSDLAYDEVRHGAQLLAIATDDAWFGTSSGPYQHAQIAQMRAVEFGDYVLRAAATGVSGIIAPDGTWQSRLDLETQGVVQGKVGPPSPTVFSRIGPNAVFLATVALYLVVVILPWKRREI